MCSNVVWFDLLLLHSGLLKVAMLSVALSNADHELRRAASNMQPLVGSVKRHFVLGLGEMCVPIALRCGRPLHFLHWAPCYEYQSAWWVVSSGCALFLVAPCSSLGWDNGLMKS